ncbi:MarR family transcriptional regulator [Actinomadura roseirufa]|uniref:MarR family transcriptional regulator n=1 Tax=Actinomadura roseirufa TaxID=2094049 RepID=UPI001A954DB2|nr:MarR family transcriptional regulator [Actinomadura roseirufa]
MQSYQAAVDDFDAAAAGLLGVNRTDLRCLEILSLEETTPKRLGDRLGLTTGSVTAMLDRLERMGHLTRSPHPNDRRRLVVRITPEATRRVSELYTPLSQEGAREVSGYTPAEFALLIGFLEQSKALYERQLARLRSLAGP